MAKKKKKKNKHLYCIKKYIVATSAKEAIKKDREHEVDDVWVEQRDYVDPENRLGFSSE